MKIKKVNQLNEGMRVNPKFLSLYGEYHIDEIINTLIKMWKNAKIQVGIFIIEISNEQTIEIDNILARLTEWQEEGASKIKGEGTEWYPLW
jgi:hypothetical protein